MEMFDKIVFDEVFSKVNTEIINFKSELIGGNTYFRACDWKWIGISRYLITKDVDENEQLNPFTKSDLDGWDWMIVGIDVSASKYLSIKNFHWYTGTYKETNTDFVYGSNDERDKLPMVWLSFTPTPKSVQHVDTDPIGQTHMFTMFFCASAYFSEFTTENHMRTRVDYLNEYVNAFIEAIKENKRVFAQVDKIEFPRFYYPKFGSFSGEKSRSIIDSQLSAIELGVTLKVKKDCKC